MPYYFYRSLVAICLCLSLYTASTYAIDPLNITQRALVYGSACDDASTYTLEADEYERPGILAGSCLLLVVRNEYDQSLEPLDSEWPEDYMLEFAKDYVQGTTFVPDESLFSQMNITYGLSSLNRLFDKLQEEGSRISELTQRNSKQYVARIPETLAGHTISFRVRFTGDGQSKESAISPAWEILEPCNSFDQARIISSEIFVSFKTSYYDHAISLADSLIGEGLTDPGGFYFAYESALHLRRYDKAMEYLEKLWTDYGVLSVSHGSPLLAKYDPNGERNYEMSIRFQGKIEHLRELLAEQEQQDD